MIEDFLSIIASFVYEEAFKIILLKIYFQFLLKMRNYYSAGQLFIFRYCNKNIELFSIVPCEDIALRLLCLIFGMIYLLFFYYYCHSGICNSSPFVIIIPLLFCYYLQEQEIAKTIAIATMYIQTWNKNKAKRLGAITLLLQCSAFGWTNSIFVTKVINRSKKYIHDFFILIY